MQATMEIQRRGLYTYWQASDEAQRGCFPHSSIVHLRHVAVVMLTSLVCSVSSQTPAVCNACGSYDYTKGKSGKGKIIDLAFLEEWSPELVEGALGGKTTESLLLVRPAFRHEQKDGWLSFPAASGKRSVSGNVFESFGTKEWNIVSFGTNYGVVQAEPTHNRSNGWSANMQRLRRFESRPIQDFGDGDITVDEDRPFKRPVPLVSEFCCKGPGEWHVQPNPGEVSTEHFEAFKNSTKLLSPKPGIVEPGTFLLCTQEDLSNLERASDGLNNNVAPPEVGTGAVIYGYWWKDCPLFYNPSVPLPYGLSDLEYSQVWKSDEGKVLLGIRFREVALKKGTIVDADDGNPYRFALWFEGIGANIHYLGSAMTLLDIADYDNDSKSEFVFWLSRHNYNGYRLFWNDFHNSADCDWHYH